MKQVTATEFKAKCLGLIDEVNASGDPVTITKRGKPVATLEPMKQTKRKTTRGILAGKIKIVGDIVNTSDLYKEWDVYQQWLAANPEPTPKRSRKAS